MSKDPMCCVSTDTAVDAARLMKRMNVGRVPVVTGQQSKKLVEIVTDRELALKVVAEGRQVRRLPVTDNSGRIVGIIKVMGRAGG